MLQKFKQKMKDDGRSYKWFIRNYLPEIKYSSFVAQINGFNPLSEEVTKAIRKYLEE